jgi:hypothetical protein
VDRVSWSAIVSGLDRGTERVGCFAHAWSGRGRRWIRGMRPAEREM